MALGKDGDRVRFTTGDFLDLHLAQSDNKLRLGLVRAAVFVLGHAARVRVAQLAAATATPRVKASLICKSDRVRVAASNLHNFNRLEQVDETGCWLVRVTLDISRQVLH